MNVPRPHPTRWSEKAWYRVIILVLVVGFVANTIVNSAQANHQTNTIEALRHQVSDQDTDARARSQQAANERAATQQGVVNVTNQLQAFTVAVSELILAGAANPQRPLTPDQERVLAELRCYVVFHTLDCSPPPG